MRHLGQAFAWDLHSNGVAGSCQEPSEVRGEITIHRGPCCPAQMLPILPAFLRLRKARMWRMGAEGGSRRRATVPGLGLAPPGLLQDPCRCEAGPAEPPRQCVCLSSLFRCPARPREEADRNLLPWQLGSSGSPAEALCLLLHSKELSVPALGG